MKVLVKCLLTFVLFLILNFQISNLKFVHAQESTKSATISASIKEKLKLLVESSASRAAKLRPEVDKKLQNRAYVGFVKSFSNTNITVVTLSGVKTVTTNDFTKISGKKVTKLKDLKPEDYIAALGDVDENDVLTAKKIMKLTAPPPADKQISWGQVVATTPTSITFKGSQGKLQTFSLTPDVKYFSSKGAVNITPTNINLNTGIIVVGTNSAKDGSFKARLIYLSSLPIAKLKISTQSAIASPSAKASSPTPTKKVKN